MKVIAMYLPQYHEVEENNEWWGNGYTEWTAVKKGVAYRKDQYQPKVPLNENYYDLSDETGSVWRWQANVANQYGVYGFSIYHYWFENGKQLLQKPAEILLNHPEIDIHYSFCWANESWTRTWYGVQSEILMKQTYGDEKDWTKHFYYLLPFFKDPRYIRVDGRPVFHFYHSADISVFEEMIQCWNKLALQNGFPGIFVVSANTGFVLEERSDLVDAYYNFEPGYSAIHKENKIERFSYGLSVVLKSFFNRFCRKKRLERVVNGKKFIKIMFRDDLITKKPIYPCVFPQWDNSPRRLYKGTFYKHLSPSLFREQIKKAKQKYDGAEFIYINAWNEWGEGAYLEPDCLNKYAYLEVIKDEFKG